MAPAHHYPSPQQLMQDVPPYAIANDAEKPWRVIVTGSRDWTDYLTVHAWLQHLGPCVVIHGGARGADACAHKAADALGFGVEVYPAEWDKHGRAAGPIRNQEMVDAGADLCLAFPLQHSRGTRDCMARAAAAGIRVLGIRVGQRPEE